MFYIASLSEHCSRKSISNSNNHHDNNYGNNDTNDKKNNDNGLVKTLMRMYLANEGCLNPRNLEKMPWEIPYIGSIISKKKKKGWLKY